MSDRHTTKVSPDLRLVVRIKLRAFPIAHTAVCHYYTTVIQCGRSDPFSSSRVIYCPAFRSLSIFSFKSILVVQVILVFKQGSPSWNMIRFGVLSCVIYPTDKERILLIPHVPGVTFLFDIVITGILNSHPTGTDLIGLLLVVELILRIDTYP